MTKLASKKVSPQVEHVKIKSMGNHSLKYI